MNRAAVLAIPLTAFALVCTATFVRGAAASPASVSVQLPPPQEAFPGGAEAEPARRHCLTCHSSDYIFTQPPLTRAQWTAEVTKMIKVYGAPIPGDAVAPIVQYLVTHNGVKP